MAIVPLDPSLGPAIFDARAESARRRWGRRLVSFSGYALAFSGVIALLPLLMVVVAVVDVVRGSRWAALRFLAMMVVYLG
jgi:uncharacterized BrkB/YihY/UPF0761 family membrane protein